MINRDKYVTGLEIMKINFIISKSLINKLENLFSFDLDLGFWYTNKSYWVWSKRIYYFLKILYQGCAESKKFGPQVIFSLDLYTIILIM